MGRELKVATGLFYEDLEVGDTATTMSRTITEADIVNFMGVSGVFEELHMSIEYIKKNSMFGQRVSPGPLTFIIAEGLAIQLGLIHHTGMALLEMNNVVWPAPTFCNDTIAVTMEVLSKRESKKSDRGIVKFRHVVRKQTGEIVLQMEKVRLIRRRPEKATAAAS